MGQSYIFVMIIKNEQEKNFMQRMCVHMFVCVCVCVYVCVCVCV